MEILNTQGRSERSFLKFSKASHSHGCIDLLPKYHSTSRPTSGFGESSSGLGSAQVQAGWAPLSAGVLGLLQKLKELFAFCLTCVLSTGFAGPGVVCQASCELLGLLCLSIVISLLLSTDFFCCLLRCSLKTLLARCSKLRVCTPRAGPGASHCPCHSPSAPACLSLSTGASTGLVELHNGGA